MNGARHAATSPSVIGWRRTRQHARKSGMLNLPLNAGASTPWSLRCARSLYSTNVVGTSTSAASAMTTSGSSMLMMKGA